MCNSLASVGGTGKKNYSINIREAENGFVVRASTYGEGQCCGSSEKEYVCDGRESLNEAVIELLLEMGVLISEEEICDECCSSKCCN